jgi:hypothetical protein
MRGLLLLAGGVASATAAACAGPQDCNMAGKCVGQKCTCITGFGGSSCQLLQAEAYHCGGGGLCLANGSATWGGSVVQADDGSFHMFAAMMTENKTLQAWLTNSVVLHAVAPAGKPQGPYAPADTALPPRAVPHFDSAMIHNPDAQRAPDGTFVIFYDGSSAQPPDAAGTSGAGVKMNPTILRQRIGLATARSRAANSRGPNL